ncbi:MAG: hypothetical protein ABII18_05790 [bacterium]
MEFIKDPHVNHVIRCFSCLRSNIKQLEKILNKNEIKLLRQFMQISKEVTELEGITQKTRNQIYTVVVKANHEYQNKVKDDVWKIDVVKKYWPIYEQFKQEYNLFETITSLIEYGRVGYLAPKTKQSDILFDIMLIYLKEYYERNNFNNNFYADLRTKLSTKFKDYNWVEQTKETKRNPRKLIQDRYNRAIKKHTSSEVYESLDHFFKIQWPLI